MGRAGRRKVMRVEEAVGVCATEKVVGRPGAMWRAPGHPPKCGSGLCGERGL